VFSIQYGVAAKILQVALEAGIQNRILELSTNYKLPQEGAGRLQRVALARCF
jgi:ABC-type thiamine transport system ATPase subunit